MLCKTKTTHKQVLHLRSWKLTLSHVSLQSSLIISLQGLTLVNNVMSPQQEWRSTLKFLIKCGCRYLLSRACPGGHTCQWLKCDQPWKGTSLMVNLTEIHSRKKMVGDCAFWWVRYTAWGDEWKSCINAVNTDIAGRSWHVCFRFLLTLYHF